MRLAWVLLVFTLPLPLSEATPLKLRSVLLPTEFRLMTPPLVLLPCKPKPVLLPRLTVPELTSVVAA